MSCYTFLSGFQPSWPPSCYPQQATSFVGSECEPTLGHFKSTLGASRITSTAYQVVVHMGQLVVVPALDCAHQGSFTLCLVVQPSHSTHSNRGEVEGSHACVLGHLDQSGQDLIWPGRRGPQADTQVFPNHIRPLQSSMSWASYTPLHSSRIGRGAMCSPGFASRALLYRT